MPNRSAIRGYSLYELLITLAIAALVLTLGVPSFGGLIADQRLTVEVNALFHAVHVARKSSIVRRRVVSLCPSVDGKTCNPGLDWSTGWLLFANVDRDSPPQVDDNEPILAQHRVSKSVRIDANRQGFTLRGTELRATNGTLVVCDRSGRAEARALVISYTGRPRVTRTDGRGAAYRCSN